MSFSFKRTMAAAAAIVCTASMCGCMDSGFVGSIDGLQIRNGVYLSYVLTAYGNGMTEVTEANEEIGDTSEVSDLFTETIDGKDAVEWVKGDALTQIKRFVAVQRLFEEKGLTVTAEDQKEVSDYVNSLWNESDFYAQYIYGTDTMGEYYESIGIGMESMKDIQMNNMMDEKLFLHIYDTNGEKAVSDADINTYLKGNYANYKYIELPFEDKYGLNLKDEADIQAVKDTAKDYVDRLNNGTSYLDIQYEHDLYVAQNKAAVDAEDNWTKDSGKDQDVAIQEAIDAATAEKHATVEELESVISKASSSLDEGLTEFIWNLADDGKAATYETEQSIYVVVRDDITTKDSWKSDNKLGVLDEIKGDEFEAYLDEVSASYSVDLDSYLIDTKYAPDKIKGINN